MEVGGVRRRVRAGSMAGGLEPHLEALRREMAAPGPAVFSVLLALLVVVITFRELRPAGNPLAPVAPRGPGGEQRPPVAAAG